MATREELQSYYDRLAAHDWLYEYANGATYERGRSAHRQLDADGNTSTEHAALFTAYAIYAYGNNKPKPERPV